MTPLPAAGAHLISDGTQREAAVVAPQASAVFRRRWRPRSLVLRHLPGHLPSQVCYRLLQSPALHRAASFVRPGCKIMCSTICLPV